MNLSFIYKKKNMKILVTVLLTAFLFVSSCNSQVDSTNNSSNKKTDTENKIITKIEEISVPEGYKRELTKDRSFGRYLQNLKLKQHDNKVYLYNGSLKGNQNAHYLIIAMDVGKRDLQQCADAVMRLRGEYLYSLKKYDDIHFNFLSDGKPRYFNDYAKGNTSYKKFRSYMNYIFAYANTSSLKDELRKVEDVKDIQIGDVFIQKGSPYGHAIIVVDMAINEKTDEKIFMLAQSYMPAQEIHILKNPTNKDISPWYKLKNAEELITPEWRFHSSDLMRF